MPPSASSEPPDACPRIPASPPAAVPQRNAAERSLFRQTSDQPEPLSRSIIAENQFGRILIEPAAKVYAAVLPGVGREGSIQFSATLKHPPLLFNTVRQNRA
jgi:ABC-type transporter lipoprotein component MlaA